MERLHKTDNIKVHFAGGEAYGDLVALNEMGIRYGLYSAYPFVYKKLFGKKTKAITESDLMIPKALNSGNMVHGIQDSGLFSLLYGSAKHLANETVVYRWYDALVEWTLEHGQPLVVVEVDCQDILGQDAAWDLRERIKKDLPNNRIMNVFHLSDGLYGLDRLIEYSDYLAISVPVSLYGSSDLRRRMLYSIASYIRSKNEDIDIHLLGCTALETIKRLNFCTSCDSIKWLNPRRFGFIQDYRVSDLDVSKVAAMVGEERWKKITRYAKINNAATLCAGIEMFKRLVEKNAGNQDYNF